MDFYSMRDEAICEELGSRIKAKRLKANVTQEELARQTKLSASTIKKMEKGHGKLVSYIAVLRQLKALDSLDAFISPVSVSPIQLMKQKGKERQRATRVFKTGKEAMDAADHDGREFRLKGTKVYREDPRAEEDYKW